MLDKELKAKLIETKPSLAEAGVAHLGVFGSQARGEATAESDIDILIEVRPGAKFSLFDLVGVEQTLSEATGMRANAVMRRSLDVDFKARITRDLIEIF